MTPLPVRFIEDTLDTACRRQGWEFSIRLSTGTDCAWVAEIEVTGDLPSRARSYVGRATGGATIEAALTEAWEQVASWSEAWPAPGDARCPGSGQHWATGTRKGSAAICPTCRLTAAALHLPRPRRLIPSGFEGRVPAHERRA